MPQCNIVAQEFFHDWSSRGQYGGQGVSYLLYCWEKVVGETLVECEQGLAWW